MTTKRVKDKERDRERDTPSWLIVSFPNCAKQNVKANLFYLCSLYSAARFLNIWYFGISKSHRLLGNGKFKMNVHVSKQERL